jgi:hypothetical protein
MKFRQVKQAANELVEMPQQIKTLVVLSFACLMIATAALIIVSVRSK